MFRLIKAYKGTILPKHIKSCKGKIKIGSTQTESCRTYRQTHARTNADKIVAHVLTTVICCDYVNLK